MHPQICRRLVTGSDGHRLARFTAARTPDAVLTFPADGVARRVGRPERAEEQTVVQVRRRPGQDVANEHEPEADPDRHHSVPEDQDLP